MKLVRPSFTILFTTPNANEFVEKIGRVCYKSEDKITEDSSEKFVKNIIKRNHLSVVEHGTMTVAFVCDRGVSHEIVRHRLASYSQESTRYCDYSGGVTFVIPLWCEHLKSGEFLDNFTIERGYNLQEAKWANSMLKAEDAYVFLLKTGWTPQQARSVLPNSTKTEIVMTANLREWRTVFSLRCSKAAHPQMRELMIPLLKEAKNHFPVVFNDLYPEEQNG